MERKGLPNKDFLLAQVFFCKKKKCVDRDMLNFTFTKDINHAIENSDISFICVPTPERENGEIDLSYIKEAAKNIVGLDPRIGRYGTVHGKAFGDLYTSERNKH
ncbi:MAG: hypothetical protein J7K81_07500 [Methanophagales archaeon]|nr:hypothetical protein [Methanophagales archaeon]